MIKKLHETYIKGIAGQASDNTIRAATVSPTNVVGQAFYRSLKFEPDVRGEYAGHSEYLSLVLRT